ncbi:hypothetical protein ACGF7W_39455 [Streptomyces sp. NPDC048219]|uniref:hypothetical protein n=1 Tax=Streptomyces sp. NPDC048219 TaxID=3365517 RepID=UPI0037141238
MKLCEGPGCGHVLASICLRGGRPRLYCSERCRSRARRLRDRIDRNLERREDRAGAVGEQRHLLRAAAYTAATSARRLAAELDAEANRPEEYPGRWRELAPERGRAAGQYTRAALEVLEAARLVVAAAVAADRAAGDDWAAVGEALGVSADTASRRYR